MQGVVTPQNQVVATKRQKLDTDVEKTRNVQQEKKETFYICSFSYYI